MGPETSPNEQKPRAAWSLQLYRHPPLAQIPSDYMLRPPHPSSPSSKPNTFYHQRCHRARKWSRPFFNYGRRCWWKNTLVKRGKLLRLPTHTLTLYRILFPVSCVNTCCPSDTDVSLNSVVSSLAISHHKQVHIQVFNLLRTGTPLPVRVFTGGRI